MHKYIYKMFNNDLLKTYLKFCIVSIAHRCGTSGRLRRKLTISLIESPNVSTHSNVSQAPQKSLPILSLVGRSEIKPEGLRLCLQYHDSNLPSANPGDTPMPYLQSNSISFLKALLPVFNRLDKRPGGLSSLYKNSIQSLLLAP